MLSLTNGWVAFTLGLVLAVSGCSVAKVEGSSAAASSAQLSAEEIYASLAELNPPARTALFAQVAKMSFGDFYERVASGWREAPLTVNGERLTAVAGSLSTLHAATTSLGQRFSTLGALWGTLAIDPSTASLADLEAGAATLNGASRPTSALSLTITSSETLACKTDHLYYQRVWDLSSNTIAAALNHQQQTTGPGSVALGNGVALKYDSAGNNGLWALNAMGFIPSSAAYLASCYQDDKTSRYEKSVIVTNPDDSIQVGTPVDSFALQQSAD